MPQVVICAWKQIWQMTPSMLEGKKNIRLTSRSTTKDHMTSTDEQRSSKNQHKNTETNKEDGLPDIADTNKKNLITFIVIAFIIVIGFYAFSHYHKTSNTNSNTDENFNIQNSSEAPSINIQPQQAASQQNTPAQVTQNNQDVQKALSDRIQAPIMAFNPQGKTHCWNPLDLIDKNSPELIADIDLVAEILISYSDDKDSMWVSEARALVKGILL